MDTTFSHLYYDTTHGKWVVQTNEDHMNGVAKLAASFATAFGMCTWGRMLGLLHDIGKESTAFQQHIMKESGYAPDIKVKGDYHHAFIGAAIARKLYGKSYDNFLANQILSHHTGLHDTDELEADLTKQIPGEIDTDVEKLQLERPPFQSLSRCDFHHLSRMLYSCLVDADYLDTESFMDRQSAALRGCKDGLETLLSLLERHLEGLKTSAKASEVNTIRNKVQQRCRDMANGPIGFYSLTVPTGGGKTLSSVLWAIRHALHNGQRRVIIAIPYTSIIVQTAAVLRCIFGDENVLEHHSNVDADEIKNEVQREKMRLATENWDYPIIVTTNVQLFESMFSNRPSKCRKLHNIVDSVLILDEVQTLPTDYLKPIVDSLNTYNRLFRMSVLFTTASQPVLSGLIEGCNPRCAFKGIDNMKEIIPKSFNLHDKLRRVRLDIDDSGRTYDEVAGMLCRHKRVLCIVNTRRDAKELYCRLPQEGITLHLSKNMCPAHIAETISRMKAALQDEKNEVIRVVSTQLVEAGVDIDFPVVYRQEAGLDSLLQAAGRCNREGKNGICTTHVFSLTKEHHLSGEILKGNNARKNVIGNPDWFAPDTMTEYFKQFYCQHDTFDKNSMKSYLYNKVSDIYFKKAAEHFRLIDEKGTNVIVCWKNSMDLVQELLQSGASYILMKKLAKYSVNINKQNFDALLGMGVVKEELSGVYVVNYKEQYDEHIGLRTDNNWANASLIV